MHFLGDHGETDKKVDKENKPIDEDAQFDQLIETEKTQTGKVSTTFESNDQT